VGFKKLLGRAAVAAPGGGINLDLHADILRRCHCYAL
jgi:hypothetical protein